ncbi:Glycosyl hydrolases family 2 [Pustulibacterium marinum]|uniref:beta-galactosidase n=1 Tax=Pustulibacterium marinum TaxID=1224947 RepID=A0A1I7HXG0_9FLAO|nr:sugar-binding domain-containing protein [Pustulibacterium marinum]SFU65373.1 Glycosyl hydrolases family 2 [Pustulibacterium marinum]
MNSLFNIRYTWLFLLIGNLYLNAQTRDTLDLEGYWNFQTDISDVGITEHWYEQALSDSILLPGSIRQRGKGRKVTLQTKWTGSIYDSSFYFHPRLAKYRSPEPKFPFWLTPKQEYLGVAWYSKNITIPKDWNHKQVQVFFERVHSESTLYFDGQLIASENSLVAPHVFDLTKYATPGKHRLTLRVTNDMKTVNVGPDSHSITDHTQGNWNGIIGKMKLIATPEITIENVQCYPNIKDKTATFAVLIKSNNYKTHKGTLRFSGHTVNTSEENLTIPNTSVEYRFKGVADTLEFTVPLGTTLALWDAHHPTLYQFQVDLQEKKIKDHYTLTTGLRTVTTQERTLLVNQLPLFLRGTLDNAVFPLTGYPEMEVPFWVDLFKKIKSYGLNHVRYHSWCPPQAAFTAADLVGIYLLAEGPSWANHGTNLGTGRPVDAYIYEETKKMEYYYGNAPSYTFMAYGNEPRGNQIAYLSTFNEYWKKRDPRRLYAGGSVGGSWPVIPNNEIQVRGGARDLDWKNHQPQSIQNFSKEISSFHVPFVAHEMGQYCVFPNFEEIEKYTGVYQARNFEMFQEDLADHYMLAQANDFLMASGALQQLMYKYTIEKALRTPGYAGYQLLSLSDYPGQGSAIVGLLDAFWDEKPYTDKADFTTYCNEVVPLVQLKKFTFTNAEPIQFTPQISNYSGSSLHSTIAWEITTKAGKVLAKGSLAETDIAMGLNTFTPFTFNPSEITTATQLNFSLHIEDTPYHNSWNFWVYPSKVTIPTPEFYQTDTLDVKAKQILDKGGKVLLTVNKTLLKGTEIAQHFMPVFWNTSWFQMRPPHTLGMLVANKHPLFNDFPSAPHSDVQWWSLVNKAPVINLEDFPTDYKPIVQPIDTWFMNRRLASVVEVQCGNGTLLLTSFDLSNEEDPVVKQFYAGVVRYMNSDAFNPTTKIPVSTIEKLFTEPSQQQFNNFSNDSPDELKPDLHK